MRLCPLTLLPVLAAPLVLAQAAPQFPPQIKNVVVIVQENRTPDNLFHFLSPACPLPHGRGATHSCTPAIVSEICYNVSPCGLSNKSGVQVPVKLQPSPLSATVDPRHSHKAFMDMCDPDPNTQQCRNDGAWRTSSLQSSYSYVDNVALINSDGTPGHVLDPYLTFATQYGWANFMFQTNQGPSYPAHQFIFGGTSAMTATDDANSTFVAENFDNKTVSDFAGCLAQPGAANAVVSPALSTPPPGCALYANGSVEECKVTNTSLIYPTNPVGTFCNSHPTMADILDPRSITWRYYATSPGSIWSAPDAIKSICEPAFADPNGNPKSPLICTGKEWNANVDTQNLGTDILRDIANCNLARVSWVTPDGRWSDHPGLGKQDGPSWVTAIINAIGNQPKCAGGTVNSGETMWQDTAIVVMWDDWGGWSDSVAPPQVSSLPCKSSDCQADYQFGFRVPLIVVSAYTPAGFISNVPHDFGSVLRMIEGINHLPEGKLGFADERSTTDMSEFFSLTAPRVYRTVPAQKDATYFLTLKGASTDPDDD